MKMIKTVCILCHHPFTDQELHDNHAGQSESATEIVDWYRCPVCGSLTGKSSEVQV